MRWLLLCNIVPGEDGQNGQFLHYILHYIICEQLLSFLVEFFFYNLEIYLLIK